MRLLHQRLYYGWMVLAAISGLNFANGATAIGVLTIFILPLTDDFGWTRTQISVATSIGAVLGALTAPFAGRLTDTWGARLPLTLGAVLIVGATLYLAAMQSLVGFYVAFSVARLADQGFVQAPSPPAIAKWFSRYRGRAMAVLFLTSSLGGVLLPPLVHLVIVTWHWRLAWVMLSAIMLCVGLLPCVLLVRRQPEDLGLVLDGGQSSRPGGLPAPAPQQSPQEPSGDTEISWPLSRALRHPTLWCVLVSTCAAGVASSGVGLHLIPYLRQQGIAPTLAVWVVSLSFLASGAATLLWGVAADKLSARALLTAAFILKLASVGALLMIHSPLAAYAYALLHGGAEGGMRTMTAVLLAKYYGRQHLGAIYGLLRALQVTGFALGPLVSGASFDLTQSYDRAFAVFLGLSLVGTVLVGLPNLHNRRRAVSRRNAPSH